MSGEEKSTMSVAGEHYDVAILGGGLAGLTLALQLKQARPASKILVLEKAAHPVPEAAHKVGESTVEIATHYLEDILGLGEHLQTQQLVKFGLRFFFSADDNEDISRRVELGLGAPPLLPSYQLDRGRLENMLGQEVLKRGVTFLDESKVEQVILQPEAHRLQVTRAGQDFEVQAHWVVDASGRSSLLKRQLGLAKKVEHRANAVWFRVARKIDVDTWSSDPAWHARITDGERYLSTNHLCGEGYWVWLIPLASGSTSVGIVTDADLHAFETHNRFDRALDWLRVHEPQCARVIEEARADVQDFRVMKNYPYSCQQVYSNDRWCLTGEAGTFVDPLYSPGSDFIAISNGFVTQLLTKELNGEDIRELTITYNHLYLSLANGWFDSYEHQYGLLGNAQVFVAKYIWDTAVYWGCFGLLYFQDKLGALAENRRLSANLTRLSLRRIQAFFREWAAIDQTPVTDAFFDHFNTLKFMEKFHTCMVATFTDEEFETEFLANIGVLERIAGQMVSKVITELSAAPVSEAARDQIQRWQADPFFKKIIKIHQQAEQSEPFNSDWIKLTSQNTGDTLQTVNSVQ